MYCSECGQLTREDRWGNLVHDYQVKDAHEVVLDEGA